MDFFEAVVRSVIVVVKIMQCSVEASAFLYETMLLLSSTFAATLLSSIPLVSSFPSSVVHREFAIGKHSNSVLCLRLS